ncbi:MAG: SDR family oxidoreductase [Myxococcota bacterium]|nr:SDR family oxidoreductase [Myxococcota bacterium]
MTGTSQSMQGRTVLMTGFTAGLGRAAVADLVGRGAHVVGLCRNGEKGEAVAREIRTDAGTGTLEILVGDLASLGDIRRAAAEFLEMDRPLHVLWNNAGLINLDRQVTEDGLEMTFAVNHLGHFLLTSLLLDRLRETESARVVNTASEGHRFGGPLDFEDLQTVSDYGAFRVYGRSKLANILFTQELARREVDHGITANCFHPGFVASDLSKNNGWWAKALMTAISPFARSPQKGAETGLYLCTSPDVAETSGSYFIDRKVRKVGAKNHRPEDGRRLWESSLALTDFPA